MRGDSGWMEGWKAGRINFRKRVAICRSGGPDLKEEMASGKVAGERKEGWKAVEFEKGEE